MSKLLKAGRPSVGKSKSINAFSDDSKLVRINFDVTKDKQLKLKMYALKEGKTVSDILREFVNSIT